MWLYVALVLFFGLFLLFVLQFFSFKLHFISSYLGEKDLRSMAVAPNETFGYIWELTSDDGPLNGDPQCLTQLYQSTISPEKDLASGLVGTLLICKNEAIDLRGKLVIAAFHISVAACCFFSVTMLIYNICLTDSTAAHRLAQIKSGAWYLLFLMRTKVGTWKKTFRTPD